MRVQRAFESCEMIKEMVGWNDEWSCKSLGSCS